MLRRGFLKGLIALLLSPVINKTKATVMETITFPEGVSSVLAYGDFQLPIGTIWDFADAADNSKIAHKVWTGDGWIPMEDFMKTELYRKLSGMEKPCD